MAKIKKILIANRGEIVNRIVSTCKEMKIQTVAIYSKTDKSLPHALIADESYSLGDGNLSETYLNIKKIIKIAKNAKANAIHPGYGFLAENANFAKAVAKAGLIFIGPSYKSLELMGNKIEARKCALNAKVPVLPAYSGVKQDSVTLIKAAKKIGYPILIKPAFGGGGKGMYVAKNAKEIKEFAENAKRVAQNAFGNSSIFIEKYLTSPHHVEIQVMSDNHGTHLHLFERECSIQRRHQKIVEETPSPTIDASLRKKMTSTAIELTKSINYSGAGTIEFLVEGNEYYFLEMNTRLQVEHSVTELTTGLDLVKMQIMVAENKKLPIKQEKIKSNGHAIEVRIYSENPERNFLPTTGRIIELNGSLPENTRFEPSYANGNFISTEYDPMLAKLSVSGHNRNEALNNLIAALNQIYFSGVKTNRNFLLDILRNQQFVRGHTPIDFISKYMKSTKNIPPAIAAYLLKDYFTHSKMKNIDSPWNRDELKGFRNV